MLCEGCLGEGASDFGSSPRKRAAQDRAGMLRKGEVARRSRLRRRVPRWSGTIGKKCTRCWAGTKRRLKKGDAQSEAAASGKAARSWSLTGLGTQPVRHLRRVSRRPVDTIWPAPHGTTSPPPGGSWNHRYVASDVLLRQVMCESDPTAMATRISSLNGCGFSHPVGDRCRHASSSLGSKRLATGSRAGIRQGNAAFPALTDGIDSVSPSLGVGGVGGGIVVSAKQDACRLDPDRPPS